MWTLTAKAKSKTWRDEGWEYQLQCEAQQIASVDTAFVGLMEQAKVHLVVIGAARAYHWFGDQGWSMEELKAQDRYNAEIGASWLEYDRLRETLWVQILLGEKSEHAAREILEETMRSPNVFAAMTLRVGFSKIEDNQYSPEPTVRRFLEGERVFARGAPTWAAVVARL